MQGLLAFVSRDVLVDQVLPELNHAFVDPCFAGHVVLAVKAQKAEAGLKSTLVHWDMKGIQRLLHELAMLHLPVELKARAVVQDLRHGHVIEGGVLLERLVAVIGHLDDNAFSHDPRGVQTSSRPVETEHSTDQGDIATHSDQEVHLSLSHLGCFPYTPRQLSQVGVFVCLTGM